MDFSASTLYTGPLLIEGVSGWFLFFLYFIELPVLNANSVNPDQASRSAASDLGLHCLPTPFLWDTRHKWVKQVHFTTYIKRLKSA